MAFENDPIGFAINDFVEKNEVPDIIVHSDLCDDDLMPVPYLFRTYDNMPPIEKMALDLCHGKVLDIGAGAGCHSIHLQNKGLKVTSIDSSKGSVDYLLSKNINAKHIDFLSFKEKEFDTLLLLMNGIGIAQSLNQLPIFLSHAKQLLNQTGQILFDSTDIAYMYIDDEGAKWMDLASEYYGEMQFQMDYKNVKTDWFPWLYIDFKTLSKIAEKTGFKSEMILNSENDQYLAKLTLK
ncbi:MAG: class I SAM-dependent methyltransferase [Crocinitomicaceae bacterium]